MRAIIAAAFILAATSAFAGNEHTSGSVAAFDRVSLIIVMEDKTIWRLNPNTVLPENLVAGEEVTLFFRSSGDDGVVAVDRIERL